MRSAARLQLETLLQARKLAGTIVAPGDTRHVAVVSSDVPVIDQRLHGGWRQGELSELVGSKSTGRTSVLMQSLASAMATGAVVALVDAFDRVDPVSAAAAGIDVRRLLWVRGPALTVEMNRTALIAQAVQQAIRAFDLIVRAGGFALVALDLADVPARDLHAVPFVTWRRLAYVLEGRPTVGLLVSDVPLGRSARGASLRLDGHTRWTGSSRQSRTFSGFEIATR